MKKKLLFLGLLLLIFGASHAQNTLKIATWNIEHLNYFKLTGRSYKISKDGKDVTELSSYSSVEHAFSFIHRFIKNNKIDVLLIQEIEPCLWNTKYNRDGSEKLEITNFRNRFDAQFRTYFTGVDTIYQFESICYYFDAPGRRNKDMKNAMDKAGIPNKLRIKGVGYNGECYGIIYNSRTVEIANIRNTLYNLSTVVRPPMKAVVNFPIGDTTLLLNVYNYHAKVGSRASSDNNTITSRISPDTCFILAGDMNIEQYKNRAFYSIGDKMPSQGKKRNGYKKSLDKIITTHDFYQFYTADSAIIKKDAHDRFYWYNYKVYKRPYLNIKKGRARSKESGFSDHAPKVVTFILGGSVQLLKTAGTTTNDAFFYGAHGLNGQIASDAIYIKGSKFIKKADTLNVCILQKGHQKLKRKIPINNLGQINDSIYYTAQQIIDSLHQKANTTVEYVIQYQLHHWLKRDTFKIKSFSIPRTILVKHQVDTINTIAFEGKKGRKLELASDSIYFKANHFKNTDSLLTIAIIDSVSNTKKYETVIDVSSSDSIKHTFKTAEQIAIEFNQTISSTSKYYLTMKLTEKSKEESHDTLDFTIKINQAIQLYTVKKSTDTTSITDFEGKRGWQLQRHSDSLYFKAKNIDDSDSIFIVAIYNEDYTDNKYEHTIDLSGRDSIKYAFKTIQEIAEDYRQNGYSKANYHMLAKLLKKKNGSIYSSQDTLNFTDYNGLR